MSRTRKNTEHDSRSPKTRTTSDALEIVDHYVIGDLAKLRDEVKEAEFELEVAQLIYDARTTAGLPDAHRFPLDKGGRYSRMIWLTNRFRRRMTDRARGSVAPASRTWPVMP